MSKTDDIHRAILAKAAQAPAPRPAIPSGARPYVAEAGQRLAEGLREENQRLKAERAGGLLVLRLDPKRVRATEFINRDERSFLESDVKFLELKESLRLHGQEHPIRVRQVLNDPAADFEIVSGHRRHRAALLLDAEVEGGFPLYALLDAKAAESRDLVLKMYRENEERADLSPFEKGAMFQHWMDSGLFPTQRAIGEAVGQSEPNIAKYLGLAALPDHVVQAFGDPRVIALRWISELTRASRSAGDDFKRKATELARHRPAPAPDAVYAALTGVLSNAAAKAPGQHGSKRDAESVKEGNKVLFELSSREGQFGIRLGKHIDKKHRKPLQRELKEWLHSWLKEHS